MPRVLRSLLYSAAVSAALCLTGLPTQAQQANDVIEACPDVPSGIACPATAKAFVSVKAPSIATDQEILKIVAITSEAGNTPRVPKKVCLNTVQGIEIMGAVVTNAEQKQYVSDVAEAMCKGNLGMGVSMLPKPIIVKPLPGTKPMPGTPGTPGMPGTPGAPGTPGMPGTPGGGSGVNPIPGTPGTPGGPVVVNPGPGSNLPISVRPIPGNPPPPLSGPINGGDPVSANPPGDGGDGDGGGGDGGGGDGGGGGGDCDIDIC